MHDWTESARSPRALHASGRAGVGGAGEEGSIELQLIGGRGRGSHNLM